jgi:hypothetical protein
MHTLIDTQAHTTEGNVREQTPSPASPSQHNSPYEPQPAQPSPTNQPTPTSAIPSQPKYHPSLFSLALLHLLSLYVSPSHPCTAEPIHALSHTLSLAYASPSHLRLVDFNSVLPRTRAPPKRKRAPFLREFFEPPKEATE